MLSRFFALIAFPLALYAEPATEWVWKKGDVHIAIDTSDTSTSGHITHWSVGGKELVNCKTTPAATLELLEKKGAALHFRGIRFHGTEEELEIEGVLSRAGEAKELPIRLSYTVQNKGREIILNITPPRLLDGGEGEFRWRLPLSLEPRKRVFFLSDHGLPWETRYFFQLTYEPRAGRGQHQSTILKTPDRNEWRYFSLEQFGPDAYRLWKAESENTAPLIMHEGRHPAPIIQLYDEHGGITLEYPQLRIATPSALKVDAARGGSAEVAFSTGGAHTIRLIAHESEGAVLQARAALHARYEEGFSPRPKLEKVLEEPDWVVKAPHEASTPLTPHYVSGGYPFSKGAVKDLRDIAVLVEGSPVPLQTKPLAFWPDKSIKWAHLLFPVAPAQATTNRGAPRVSFRSGKALAVEVLTEQKEPVSPPHSLSVTSSERGDVQIQNGELKVTLAKGANWLQELSWKDNRLVDASVETKRASVYSHYRLNPKSVFPFATSPEGGSEDRGMLEVESVSVEETGPLRAVVRLEGLTNNREPTRMVLRLEFLAGRSQIRFTHTAIFRFQDPRRTFLTGMGLELPLPTASTPFPQALIQRSVEHRQWHVGGKALYGNEGEREGWLNMKLPGGSMTAAIRNLRQMAPKALLADRGRLRFELWPESVEPMDVRRYSNSVHAGQLEGPTGVPEDWVEKVYYKTEPFYGVSRTHEMVLAFHSDEADAAALTADLESPPLLYAGWDTYTSTGVVLPSSTIHQWPRAWAAWSDLARFFLYHRELHRWYGFWNFGDFRHRFRSGYGWTLPGKLLAEVMSGRTPDDPATLISKRVRDYFPPNDWNYDNGAYGWSNTEGLPGLFLQHEYLRHGNRAIYFAAEAMARYSRDVVTRQEGRWLGRGTRHGVQPWSDGNHDERQTTITEYRLHYFLSGEGRSRDVIENLYTNAYTKGTVRPSSFHSARLGGLLFHWEITGAEAEREQLSRYIKLFLSQDGLFVEPAARFPGPVEAGAPRKLNSGTMFFHTFGGMHALLEYQQLVNDPEVALALTRMADAVIERPIIEKGLLGKGDYSWPPVAYAALHANAPAPYRDFLRRYITNSGWRVAYQPVSQAPDAPNSFMADSVALTFFWANWAPYVTLSLGEEVWSEEIAVEMEKRETREAIPRKTSWQSDYDSVPELEGYLGSQLPWRQSE